MSAISAAIATIKLHLTHCSPALLFYTSWKHQKIFRFSDAFRGYRKATLGCNGLKSKTFFSVKHTCFLKFNKKIYIRKSIFGNLLATKLMISYKCTLAWIFCGKFFQSLRSAVFQKTCGQVLLLLDTFIKASISR